MKLKEYESDFTKFLKELKQKDPNLEEKQRNGRLLLWDKGPLDLDNQRRAAESRVKQNGYVYQSKL
ncbi:acetyl-CoA carboxylase carboxyltransferase subunit alpha [Noviherbaspirillum humi]|uniref:Acetyl-CoA carboxylase carboxyltransferase subunit alpha n=1 Tax=Noviherbaspirillum humi TaxID=1688639 RepID=A0A239GRJ7_9BURK|nr:DUF3460 family protein [Noviherbaspirillum humi]SNS71495.1 acetyl-CoA carboxylase carboxyltransferase subunit alpha [Noviherbaspirillum humi]